MLIQQRGEKGIKAEEKRGEKGERGREEEY